MISKERLNELLEASPAERITPDYIESRIQDVSYKRLQGTLTHCTILLDNGYHVTGESSCVNPENYNQEIGESIAYENAYEKLWPLFGFLLAEKNFNNQPKKV